MSKSKSKTRRKAAPKAPKAPKVDRTLTVNARNGAIESDRIWIDGVLCDKRSKLPV